MLEVMPFIPYGKIHQLQINDKELYAFEPLICDSICEHTRLIADARKKLSIPSDYPNQTELLADIQIYEGKLVILKDILEQLGLPWEQ